MAGLAAGSHVTISPSDAARTADRDAPRTAEAAPVAVLVGAPDAQPSEAPRPVPAVPAPDAESPTTPEDAGPTADELERIEKAVLAGEASPEEVARFWKLARTSRGLDDLILRLEKGVAEATDPVAARMNLARAYVAKLYTVPNGPERGAWASRAETEWRAVLAEDARNEEARMSLAISLSQWPDFFGKTPEAIRQLETLKTQQEADAPEAGQAATWLRLSELYLGRGRRDDATRLLRDGAARFPDDTRFAEALHAAGG